MLEEIERVMLTFSAYNIKVSFREYVDTLIKTFSTTTESNKSYLFFEQVFMKLTGFKKDFMSRGDLRIFITQLLTGIRFSEVTKMGFRIHDDNLSILVNTSKTGAIRKINYSLDSPLIGTFYNLLTASLSPISYKSYYRSLLNSNPNFYIKFADGHLHATHITRHFFIQVLFYVLNMSKKEIQGQLSWFRDDTIESYIDLELWKNLNIGVKHGKYNNNLSTAGRSTRLDNSGSHSRSTNRLKDTKKKVTKKKKKE